MTNLISREEYASRITELKERYAHLLPTDATIDPGPGWLDMTGRFLAQINGILTTSKLDFCKIAEHRKGSLSAFLDFTPPLTEGRHAAIAALIDDVSRDSACSCRACGDRIGGGFRFAEDDYCAAHHKLATDRLLFADEVTPELLGTPDDDDIRQTKPEPQTPPAIFDEFLGSPEDCDDDNEVVEPPSSSPGIQLFIDDDLLALEDDAKGRERDTRNRVQAIIKELKVRGPRRDLATLPEHWQPLLDQLETEFPNFDRFIDTLRSQFMLSEFGDRRLYISPILLNGPPGIGKSEILSRLAALLGMPAPLMVDFSTAQSSSVLTGSDAHWSNTREGELFKSIAMGPIANPIVLIDEIEKSSGDGRYNPTSALYGLLERTNARKFFDLSLRSFPIDASNVLWFAASNRSEDLDPPIRSRFTVIQVEPPTPLQARQIQRSIFKELRVSEPWGVLFNDLPEATLDAITGLSPREAKLLMRMGAGQAMIRGRNEIYPEDIRAFMPKRKMAANFLPMAA